MFRLVGASGTPEFFLNREGDTLVGRADPVTGITPDIDLTPLDTQRSTSRRHAKLYQMGGTFYVMEEIGVMNGTFVNDQRLATGAPMAIQNAAWLSGGAAAANDNVEVGIYVASTLARLATSGAVAGKMNQATNTVVTDPMTDMMPFSPQ